MLGFDGCPALRERTNTVRELTDVCHHSQRKNTNVSGRRFVGGGESCFFGFFVIFFKFEDSLQMTVEGLNHCQMDG